MSLDGFWWDGSLLSGFYLVVSIVPLLLLHAFTARLLNKTVTNRDSDSRWSSAADFRHYPASTWLGFRSRANARNFFTQPDFTTDGRALHRSM